MANIFLLYDNGLQYSTVDKEGTFQPMGEETRTGCNSGEEVIWQISQFDTQIDKLKGIDTKNKKNYSLPKGHWKDTWQEKPKKSGDTLVGIPVAPDATKEDPAVFAYDIVFKLKSKDTDTTVDPGVNIPPE